MPGECFMFTWFRNGDLQACPGGGDQCDCHRVEVALVAQKTRDHPTHLMGEVVVVFESDKFFSLTVLDIPAAEMRKAAS